MFLSKIIRIALPFLGITFSVVTFSCKKNNDDYGNPAVIQVLNALDDNVELRVNNSGKHPIRYISAAVLVNKGYMKHHSIITNQFPQVLTFYAGADTLEKDRPVVNTSLDLTAGAAYSFFVFGSKAAPEYFLHKDDHTRGNPGDSMTFIRFVNLVPGRSIEVNIKGDNNVVGVAGFKELTAFAAYKVDMSVLQYEFEFRDQSTGTLLASYTANIREQVYNNTWFNKTNTLVLTGKMNGTGVNAPAVVVMPHNL